MTLVQEMKVILEPEDFIEFSIETGQDESISGLTFRLPTVYGEASKFMVYDDSERTKEFIQRVVEDWDSVWGELEGTVENFFECYHPNTDFLPDNFVGRFYDFMEGSDGEEFSFRFGLIISPRDGGYMLVDLEVTDGKLTHSNVLN